MDRRWITHSPPWRVNLKPTFDAYREVLSLRPKAFDRFWIQLYKNIGHSWRYRRFVIVEPKFGLVIENESVRLGTNLDALTCRGQVGEHAADFVNQFDETDEQVLEPFIGDKRYSYILLSDEFPRISEPETHLDRLLKTLGDAEEARNVHGLVHYHIREPTLNRKDYEALALFTRKIKAIGGCNQIGMVVSDESPSDTLRVWNEKHPREYFVEHLRNKLEEGRISVSANFFDGSDDSHPEVSVRIV